VRIALGSAFRNMAGAPLRGYVEQMADLRDALRAKGHVLRWIAVEGDSYDATRQQMREHSERLLVASEFITRNHGGPHYSSTEAPERMKALSYVGNGILESVHEEDDVLVYVESDLLWTPSTILRLIDQLAQGIDVIAPLIFAGECFYDVWAFRKNGSRFAPFAPYHSDLGDGLTTVDSAGSCLVMRAEVARQCRIINDEALVGFCRDVWSKGFGIYCDPRERVLHP
jgi:hypothetical protein